MVVYHTDNSVNLENPDTELMINSHKHHDSSKLAERLGRLWQPAYLRQLICLIVRLAGDLRGKFLHGACSEAAPQ